MSSEAWCPGGFPLPPFQGHLSGQTHLEKVGELSGPHAVLRMGRGLVTRPPTGRAPQEPNAPSEQTQLELKRFSREIFEIFD